MARAVRALTEGEIELAKEAFGNALRLDTVRLIVWPFARAFVAGRWFGRDWIVWPRRAMRQDFAIAPMRTQGVLIHELTHVWQAQQGVNLLWAKLKAGDRRDSYAYAATSDCQWDALNIEQQAMVMEHRFRRSRGESIEGDDVFFARVCPF